MCIQFELYLASNIRFVITALKKIKTAKAQTSSFSDLIHWFGNKELISLLSVTLNYVVSVPKGFFFLFVCWVGCVIFLWHYLGLPYNYLTLSVSSSKKKCLLFLAENKCQCCLWLRLQCHNTEEHGKLTMSSMKFFAYRTYINYQYSSFIIIYSFLVLFHITSFNLGYY